MTPRVLTTFFALAFGVSWGILALFVLFTAQAEAAFGKMGYTNPLFIVAVYAPALAGIFLVWRHHGLAGLGHFARRLTLWHMPWPWWALLVFGIPAVFYAGAAIRGTLGGPFPFSPWTAVLPALLTTLLIGPIEEFGWRGVALPLMQRRLAPFWAALWLGIVWAVWHVPAFFLSGTPQSNWSLPGFFVGCVALSLILTPMFNAAKGSLLVAALFHFQVNGPAWPDSQPWDSVIFAALAAVIVVFNRVHYFDRNAGAMDVLANAVHLDRLPEAKPGAV
jgi:membrane protease YdiL (CAAX protease family)